MQPFRSVPLYKSPFSFRFKTERRSFSQQKRPPNGTVPFLPNKPLSSHMKLPTEMVLDGPGGKVEDAAACVEDFETLMEASMGQTSLVMPRASTNAPTLVQPE